MMTPDDPILAAPRGSIDGALARGKNAKRYDDFVEYVHEVFRLSVAVGVDPAIVIAQWDLETGTGTSRWWNERLNPAGIGITGWEPDNEKSKVFASGVEAARAQIAHLLLYATGKIDRGGLTPKDDPRYDAYVEGYGNTAKATTLRGLNGTWAIDKDNNYHGKIASRGNQIWPNLGPFEGFEDEQEQPVPMPNVIFNQKLNAPNMIGGATIEFTITEDDENQLSSVLTITKGDTTIELTDLNDQAFDTLSKVFAGYGQAFITAYYEYWMKQYN